MAITLESVFHFPSWGRLDATTRRRLGNELIAASDGTLSLWRLDPAIVVQHVPTAILFTLVPGGTARLGFSESDRNDLRTQYQYWSDCDEVELQLDRPWNRRSRDAEVAPFLLATRALSADQLAWLRSEATISTPPPPGGRTLPNLKEKAKLSAAAYVKAVSRFGQGTCSQNQLPGIEEALTRFGMRLPSEPEWVQAARGGTQRLFPSGQEIPASPNLGMNPLGFVDMAADFEVCADSWTGDAAEVPSNGRPVRGEGARVVKGGAAACYPWQDCGEWTALLVGNRMKSADNDGFLVIRPVLSLKLAGRTTAAPRLRKVSKMLEEVATPAKKRKKAKSKAKPKKPNTPLPAAQQEFIARLEAVDWSGLTRGDAAKFPKVVRKLLEARTHRSRQTKLDNIGEHWGGHPVRALMVGYLLELAAIPDAPAPTLIIAEVVAMLLEDHTKRLAVPYCGDDEAISFTGRSTWAALTARRDIALALLDHELPDVQAHAAFLLAWMGHSDEIVPRLWELASSERPPLVRASALIALGVQGADGPFQQHLSDTDPRVALAAALAASFGSNADEPVLACLEAAMSPHPAVLWEGLPWHGGDLTRFALTRYLAMSEQFPERTKSLLMAQLDSKVAPDVAVALLRQAFPKPPGSEPLTPEQHELLATFVHRPKARWGYQLIDAIRDVGVPTSMSKDNRVRYDFLRRSLGLPRLPPVTGVLAKVTHDGQTRFAQHWWADFAESGKPEAEPLARAIVEQLERQEVLDLVASHQVLEPSLGYLEEYDLAIREHPEPAGGTRNEEGVLTWPGLCEPIALAYLEQLQAQGWDVDDKKLNRRGLYVWAYRRAVVLYVRIWHPWNDDEQRADFEQTHYKAYVVHSLRRPVRDAMDGE